MDDQSEVMQMLGKIDGKLDMVIAQQNKDEKRITKLETKVWWASGGVAAIGLLLGAKMKELVGL